MESFVDLKQFEEITRALTKLTLELQSRIKQNHDILIYQATWIGLLNSALDVIDTNLVKVKDVTNKSKTKALVQYSSIEKDSIVLKKVCNTAHKIRSCSKLINLVHKMKSENNVSKAALRSEIDSLPEDLKKFRFIQSELSYIASD